MAWTDHSFYVFMNGIYIIILNPEWMTLHKTFIVELLSWAYNYNLRKQQLINK